MLNQAATTPDPAVITVEIEKLAASSCFRKAERCLRLLRYLTDRTLEGRAGDLKEYVLGVAVFERPDSYDPRTDPVVRLEARRLRLKLAEYYQSEGANDDVVIDLPKGAYVPQFRFRVVPDVSPPTAPAKSAPLVPRWIWAAAAVLVLAAAIAGSLNWKQKPVSAASRPSVALVGFRNLSPTPDSAWAPAAIVETLNAALGAGRELRTIPLENVARMRAEIALTPETTYPAHLLQRIREDIGTDYVISGTLSDQSHRLRLNAFVLDARTGQQSAVVADESSEDDIPALAERVAARIRSLLGLRLASGVQAAFVPGSLEPYALGMERLRQGDAPAALTYLEKAAAKSPANPLVQAGLAAAWAAEGLDIRAEEAAKRALDSSGNLGRIEQLEIEGRYATLARDWPRAIRVYQALFTLLPDDLEYGLALAVAQARGGQAQQASTVFQSLRALPLPVGGDPRIDLGEAQAAGALSDFAKTQQSAHDAAEKAKARGARLLYAKARLLEAGAIIARGRTGFAEIRAEARAICAELGDRACVAASYRSEANEKAMRGELAAAAGLYGHALEIADQIGNRLEQLNTLNGFAYTSERSGDLGAAEHYLRRAVEVAGEMGNQKRYLISLNLATVLIERGNLAEARTLIAEGQKVAEQVGEKEGLAEAQTASARLLAFENRPAESIQTYRAAVATLRAADAGELRDALLDLGNMLLRQNDLAAARKCFEESRTLSERAGDLKSPEVELAFARLNLAENRLPDAVSHAQKAFDSFTASGRQGDRLEAAAVLSRAWLRQGEATKAATLLGQLPSLDARNLPPENVVELEIARCMVVAQQGRRDEAAHLVNGVAAIAARAGIPQLEREAHEARKALAQ